MKIDSITIFSLQLLPTIATAAAVKNLVVFGDSNSGKLRQQTTSRIAYLKKMYVSTNRRWK